MMQYRRGIFLISVAILFLLVGGGVIFHALFSRSQPLPALFPHKTEAPKDIPFRPEDLMWEEISTSTPWGARDAHAAIVFKGKIWLTGGLNANNTSPKVGNVAYEKAQYFNDLWNSDDGVRWNRVLEHAPWPPARSQRFAVFRDKMWLIGGWSPENGYAKEIWMSEDGYTWSSFAPRGRLPEIEGHQLVVFKDALWLIGGVRYTDHTLRNEIWATSDGIHWTLKVTSAPWSGRWDHAVAEFKGALWLLGGMNLQDDEFNDVWRSLDGVQWEKITEHAPWATRQGHEAVVYKDRLWIVGRLNDAIAEGPNDIWFSEDGYTWEKTRVDPPWFGREDHEVIVFKDAMWVLGGMTTEWRWAGDIWRSFFSYSHE